MIIHFFTRFKLLEDRTHFVTFIRYLCKEKDHATSGKEVEFEKVWQVNGKETND